MRELEGAQALLEAKRPLKTRCGSPRSPCWAGKAVAGIVNAVDRDHREVMTTNRAPDERRAGL